MHDSINTVAGVALLPGVNVKNFGAVGDGVADDTAALQSAFDAAAFTGNGPLATGAMAVVIPSGHYRITAPLRLEHRHQGITILGAGRPNALGGEFPGAATRIFWDGPDGGILLDIRALLGFRMADIALDGAGKARVCMRVNSRETPKQLASADFTLERLVFANADTGMECGGDSYCCSSDMSLYECEFFRLEAGLHTQSVQNLNYHLARCSFGIVDICLHFQAGGNCSAEMLGGWECGTMLKVDEGGINAGVFHFHMTRMETRIHKGKRTTLLEAKGEVNVKFTALETTCCGLIRGCMGNHPDADLDPDTPLFILGPTANVAIESSMICGNIAVLTGDPRDVPTWLQFDNCRFRLSDPRTGIRCDAHSGYELRNCTLSTEGERLFIPLLKRLPAQMRMGMKGE